MNLKQGRAQLEGFHRGISPPGGKQSVKLFAAAHYAIKPIAVITESLDGGQAIKPGLAEERRRAFGSGSDYRPRPKQLCACHAGKSALSVSARDDLSLSVVATNAEARIDQPLEATAAPDAMRIAVRLHGVLCASVRVADWASNALEQLVPFFQPAGVGLCLTVSSGASLGVERYPIFRTEKVLPRQRLAVIGQG